MITRQGYLHIHYGDEYVIKIFELANHDFEYTITKLCKDGNSIFFTSIRLGQRQFYGTSFGDCLDKAEKQITTEDFS